MIKNTTGYQYFEKTDKIKLHFLLDINLIYFYSARSMGSLAQFLYLKNSKQFPLAIGESPSEKRVRQQESKPFNGEFEEISGVNN